LAGEKIFKMKNWLTQLILILLISTIASLAVNSGRGGGIAIIGDWPTGMDNGEEPVKPPSAEEGDPPFITLEDAAAKYQSPDIIFIDSRSPEDFEYGHVKGAINIPFDYLDESWDEIIDSMDRSRGYVVYCSGGECETSLHLGRYLYDLGFPNVSVFFGGWSEWESNNLPIVWGNEEAGS
jgi:rhodanese-related sulfurtransferase